MKNEKLLLERFTEIYMFWIREAPMVVKAKMYNDPYEIPYVSLRDTTWGKSIKALYGKEYDER
jgi:hypothetical protein